MKYFVPKNLSKDCLSKINKNNMIILVGNPGVGKTFTSKYIIAKYIEQGYKLLYSPNKKLKDIFEQYNDLDKFILFIDDIFGANNMDFMNYLNDDEIISILNNRNSNLKIVVNSRTSIFENVNNSFEKINRLRLKPYIIETSNLSYSEKARILIKHLMLSNISNDQIRLLFENNKKGVMNIVDIIYHDNYNPRLIEYITKKSNINKDNYVSFIFDNLNNPKEIYLYSFNNNLNDDERLLLKILFVKSNYNKISTFYSVYELINRINGISYLKFLNLLKKLSKSFISIEKIANVDFVSFYNPSIYDFLYNLLKNDYDMIDILNNTNEVNDLDMLILNDSIDINIRFDKIRELKYHNFKYLKELYDDIVTDSEMILYIKNTLLNLNDKYRSSYDFIFINDVFFSNEDLSYIINNYFEFFNYYISITSSNNYLINYISFYFNKFSDDLKNCIISSFYCLFLLFFENEFNSNISRYNDEIDNNDIVYDIFDYSYDYSRDLFFEIFDYNYGSDENFYEIEERFNTLIDINDEYIFSLVEDEKNYRKEMVDYTSVKDNDKEEVERILRDYYKSIYN